MSVRCSAYGSQSACWSTQEGPIRFTLQQLPGLPSEKTIAIGLAQSQTKENHFNIRIAMPIHGFQSCMLKNARAWHQKLIISVQKGGSRESEIITHNQYEISL